MELFKRSAVDTANLITTIPVTAGQELSHCLKVIPIRVCEARVQVSSVSLERNTQHHAMSHLKAFSDTFNTMMAIKLCMNCLQYAHSSL
jgi:hypothetical protein